MSDSIWKKEITFRRKSPDGPERQESFWTKEISLSRRHARKMQIQQLADEALRQVESTSDDLWGATPEFPPPPLPDIEVTPVEPAVQEQTSIWKREISLKRQPKEAPTEDPAAVAGEPDEPAPEPVRAKGETRRVWRPKESASPARSGGHPVKRMVGLKIGASQLAAARVANNGAAELL